MEASGGPGGAARAGAAAGTLAASETIAAVGPSAAAGAEPEADPARLAEATAAAAGLAAASGRAGAERSAEPRPDGGPSDDTARMEVPLAAAAGAAGAAGAAAATRPASSSGTAPAPMAPVVRPRSGSAPSRAIEDERLEGRRGPRAPVLVGLAVAGLAIVVLGRRRLAVPPVGVDRGHAPRRADLGRADRLGGPDGDDRRPGGRRRPRRSPGRAGRGEPDVQHDRCPCRADARGRRGDLLQLQPGLVEHGPRRERRLDRRRDPLPDARRRHDPRRRVRPADA